MKPNEYIDRDYIYGSSFLLFSDVTMQLVKDERNHRSVPKPDNNNELVEAYPEIYKEIKNILTKLSKFIIYYIHSKHIVEKESYHFFWRNLLGD